MIQENPQFEQSSTLQQRSYAGLVGDPGCIVASVEGQSSNVGKMVQLPSGATVKMKADGAWLYQLAHAFAEDPTHATAVDVVKYEVIEGAEMRSGVLSVCIDFSDCPKVLTQETQLHRGDDHDHSHPLRIMATAPTHAPISIDLRKACGQTTADSAVVLLKESMFGISEINDEGILTFVPKPSFAGNTIIKCLVEQADGASRVAEIMITITRPVQFFDGV